jgi:hypothetical protein
MNFPTDLGEKILKNIARPLRGLFGQNKPNRFTVRTQGCFITQFHQNESSERGASPLAERRNQNRRGSNQIY